MKKINKKNKQKDNINKFFKLFIPSILAGISISLAGFIFLSVDNKYLGSVLFTLGLFLVCTRSYNLYTGKVCYCKTIQNIKDLLIIILGNFIGTNIIGLLLRCTRYATSLTTKANSIIDIKLSDNLLSLFILAIICNVFIFVAVDGYKKSKDNVSKYLSLFFGVIGFVITGTEHVVADMFYFAVAGNYTSKAFIILLIVFLGNTVGGRLYSLIEEKNF